MASHAARRAERPARGRRAGAVADEFGWSSTHAAVATAGVTVRSLYKHINGLQALKRDPPWWHFAS